MAEMLSTGGHTAGVNEHMHWFQKDLCVAAEPAIHWSHPVEEIILFYGYGDLS